MNRNSNGKAELVNEEIVRRFRSLSIWNKGGQRAPHKPLLCLLAISKMVNEKKRLLRFEDIEGRLRGLLTEFGPPRKVCHPEERRGDLGSALC